MIVPPEIQSYFRRSPLIGGSPFLRELRDMAKECAEGSSHILILGETGSGRETLARYIHDHSHRTHGPFIQVDCASLDENHLERELFGHVAGASTASTQSSLGCLRSAHKGTLFLEEFDEISPPLQEKLLDVLQFKCAARMGGEQPVTVDVRVICSTSRSLTSLLKLPNFNRDLFFYLTDVTLRISPLRQRQEDVTPLAEHFLRRQARLYGERLKTIAPEAAEKLRAYLWPKNAQELFDVMEQAHILASGPTITPEDLPPGINRHS